ncbi:zinc-ribbon domain-containing protein [Halonatronum saccharophilum]|uniref:YfgJ family double zinc ribbon protein n=1 Tax=Halonatronum saccharophilum TaxID=150060 RepID=UPI000484DECE|nr:zinc-ribbon domain-containing protein [Halonatronum saccharophilum]
MKKPICEKCNNIMKTKFKEGKKIFFCKSCNEYSDYSIKEIKNYCDNCNEQLEIVKGCGSISFFCNNCNKVKSKNKVKIKILDLNE